MAGANNLRVLIVDDNRNLTLLLAYGLRAEGYTVETVNDATVALERARSFKPDAILSDLSMPGLDGYSFARQVRADEGLKHVRLIAGTGVVSPENVTQCYDAGFNVYIEKPFTHRELCELLAQPPAEEENDDEPEPALLSSWTVTRPLRGELTAR